jgi:predicted metallopeptidase
MEDFLEPLEINDQDDSSVELDPTGRIALSGKELLESPEMESFGKQVLEKENIDLRPAEVGYLLVYPNISKTVVAKCLKCSREIKYYSGYDYLIEISGEAWDHLDEKTKYMLIYHEMLHIQPVFNEKKEEWNYRVRPHDFGDFYEINDKHGSDWYKTVQSTVSSLYDMNPMEEGKITF